MALMMGRDIGQRFLAAFGLAGRPVTRFTLTAAVSDGVRLEYEEIVLKGAEPVAVRAESMVTTEQMAALEEEVASLASAPYSSWAEPGQTATLTSAERRLLGPAECLAVAVLNGDRASALLLADKVLEEWASLHRGEEA